MPRKKAAAGFTWNGKPVSKTTYFRRKAASAAAPHKTLGISPEDLVRAPLQADPVSQAGPQEQSTSPKPVDPVDDALLRDFMVGMRSRPPLSTEFPLQVTPRLAVAILRLLDRMGY